MKRVGIVFWPPSKTTLKAGNLILKAFTSFPEYVKAEILNFDEITERKLKSYDCLVIGGKTLAADNWSNANFTNRWGDFLKSLWMTDLSKVKIALFGLGDQINYPYNFVDGMGELYEEMNSRGARICGRWSTENYDFADSKAVDGEFFIGLAIDDCQQPELTDNRIEMWVDQLIGEFK